MRDLNFYTSELSYNTPPKMDDLIKGMNFIDEEINRNGKVYIHCRQGLGRGPQYGNCLFCLKLEQHLDHAFALVKSVRPFINPTRLQIQRLKELEIYFKESLTN